MWSWLEYGWRGAFLAVAFAAPATLHPTPACAHGPLDHEIVKLSVDIARSPGNAALLERRARLYLALRRGDAALEDAGDADGLVLRARILSALDQLDPAARAGLAEGIVRLGSPVALLAEVARLDGGGGRIEYGEHTGASGSVRAADARSHMEVVAARHPTPRRATLASVSIHRNSSNTDVDSNSRSNAAMGTAAWLPACVRGPYLHLATPTSVVVRWRTDVATDSRVRYGDVPGSTASEIIDPLVTTEHEVAVTGLSPESRYYYSVGSTAGDLAGGDATHYFRTHPVPGERRVVRIWAIGDSGSANLNARNVRDAYLAWPGADMTDVWLMLGDNAYTTGLDTEYQAAVFDTYPQLLRNTVLWPTRGNHDVLHAGPGNDYYEIFTMPTMAEAGGLPSGTEAYYSFDFANVHFICLDSHGSDRSPGGAMNTWLAQDIAATPQEWVIAYWHHPPYTKGSHDSDNFGDSGGRMADMRQHSLPILEQAGVDLVLAGHSHSYERSFLLNGHYGLSTTLSAAMRIDDGDGSESGDGAYHKPSLGKATNEGTVYAVVGSSSKAEGGALNHAVMTTSLNQMGSLVIDVDGNRMDVRFLDDNGSVLDVFTVRKGIAASAPVPAAALRLGVDSENPFRSTLRFRIDTPAPGPVTLSVYDVRGRRVAILSSGHRGAGIHFVTWDGRNTRGDDVAPGVYFGMLDYAGEMRTRKIVRIR